MRPIKSTIVSHQKRSVATDVELWSWKSCLKNILKMPSSLWYPLWYSRCLFHHGAFTPTKAENDADNRIYNVICICAVSTLLYNVVVSIELCWESRSSSAGVTTPQDTRHAVNGLMARYIAGDGLGYGLRFRFHSCSWQLVSGYLAYTDHHQGRGYSSRPTAILINIHEPVI